MLLRKENTVEVMDVQRELSCYLMCIQVVGKTISVYSVSIFIK